MGGGQDWSTVAFSSKPNTGTAAGKAQSLKDAQRTGGQISTQAKAGGGGNKQVTAAGLKAQSLEDDSETLARTPLPVGRQALGRACEVARLASSIAHCAARPRAGAALF